MDTFYVHSLALYRDCLMGWGPMGDLENLLKISNVRCYLRHETVRAVCCVGVCIHTAVYIAAIKWSFLCFPAEI